MKAEEMKKRLSRLLLDWCDSLVRLQVDEPGDKSLNGAIFCPACKTVHGRCHEAVYPLLCAARLTGDKKYIRAAAKLFFWGENMLCPDGAFKNDFTSDWKGVTVFAAISLHDALSFHGELLTKEEKSAWEARLLKAGEWLNEKLKPGITPAYLNYYAANACALALLGSYFSRNDFRDASKELAAHCLKHVSESELVFGEGSPNGAVSPKGCRAIDIGYNVEETLPCLTRYATVSKDEAALGKCRELWLSHLEWMLPDGAWDNSSGTRSFKWTYWGSRTADGCLASLFELGKHELVFAEAALRNFELLEKCTSDGLLFGGPDYKKSGEPPCVHHSFCHAKDLALALDNDFSNSERCSLPSDTFEGTKHYPELDVFRLACGKWRMTVSGYDFTYKGAEHTTGGSISLLWNKDAGPLIAVGMVDYALREPNNQQLPVHPEAYRCACPRIEASVDGTRFGQHYCKTARISAETADDQLTVKVKSLLCGSDGQQLKENAECSLEYVLSGEALTVRGRVSPAIAESAGFFVPLIGDKADVDVLCGTQEGEPERFFNLSPGFAGKEYVIKPDESGAFEAKIKVTE